MRSIFRAADAGDELMLVVAIGILLGWMTGGGGAAGTLSALGVSALGAPMGLVALTATIVGSLGAVAAMAAWLMLYQRAAASSSHIR